MARPVPSFAIGLAIALLAGCAGREDAAPAFVRLDPARLDGARALREVADFVTLGPKVAGTPAMEKAAAHLRDRLLSFGVEARVESFEDDTPAGKLPFRNVLGRIPGGRPGVILLASHSDTKDLPDFPGANDGGSSSGLLLEIARVLKESAWRGPEIQLAFFDGEEAKRRYAKDDGLHGSRRLAAQIRDAGRVAEYRAMILLDMVGDRDLTITLPSDTRPAMARLVFESAEALGARDRFAFSRTKLLDDHVPFQELGIPAVDLIDFQYGSKPGWNDYWHTPQDTLDKLSAESLQTVGRVVLEMLNRLAAP